MSWFCIGRHLPFQDYKWNHVEQAAILVCVVCALLIFKTLYSGRTGRGKRLSRLVRRERNSLYRLRLWDRLCGLLRDCYYPPKALQLVLPLLIAWWVVLYWLRVSPTSEALQLITRLQQLEVGIAMVFVPLMIFAVGLSVRRSVSGLNVAEVLLAETYLFPIAIFILGLLGAFIFLSNPLEAKLSIALTLLGASFVLYRLCNTLLDDYYLHSAAVRLLQDKIRRSIGTAVDIRIGHSLLLAELADTNIVYDPLPLLGSSAQPVFIPSLRKGTITDIDIEKLISFSNILAVAADDAGISFAARQERFPFQGSNDNAVSNPQSRPLTKEKPPCIIHIFGDEVTDLTDNLMAFPRRAVQDEKMRRRLVKLARGAISIRPRGSYSQRVRKYMRAVKDEAILAIRDQRTTQLEDLLNVYVSAGDTFLQEMQKLGGYNLEAAQRERQNLFGSWAELDWITRDLRELHRRGCLSEEIIIVQLVAEIPERIARLAIRYGDHLVFDAMTCFALYEYFLRNEVSDLKIKEFLAEHPLRSLQELADYGIVIELRRQNAQVGAIESVGSLVTILLLRFQSLLKTSLMADQIEIFCDCRRRVGALLGTLDRGVEQVASGNLDGLLEEDKESFRQALARKKAMQEVVRSVVAQKQLMSFSVGSLVLDMLIKPEAQGLVRFMAEIDLQVGPADLTRVFLELSNPEMEERWGNQLLDYPQGGGAVGSAHEMFAKYYSFLLLKSVQNFNDATFRELRLPSTPELVLELDVHGPIRNSLSSFETHRDIWGPIVPNEWLSKLPKLYSLFDTLISEQRRKDEDQLIGTGIDAIYLKQFQQRFVKTFAAEAGLRQLFVQFKAYVQPSSDGNLGSPVLRWGANILDSRESYIDGLRRSSVKWPEEYARNLALSESEKAFHEILGLIPETKQGQDGVVLSKQIANLEVELEKSGAGPDVMLVGGDCSFFYADEWAHLFIPEWSTKATKWSLVPGFQGVLKLKNSEVPIIQVRTNQDGGTACLLSFRVGISWRQYLPFDSEDEQEYLEKFFFFRIIDLAAEKGILDQIIRDNPAWLQDIQEKERYLQQRVWLRVFERFEIQTSGKVPGLKFRLVS
jgi:hypothetical protein